MSEDMVCMMRSLFLPLLRGTRHEDWRPCADVYRTPRGWLVKLDVAGVRAEDIVVQVRGSELSVRGSRRDVCREEGYNCYRLEIAYTEFERRVELPCDLQRAGLESELRDGMLFVHIETETEK